MKRWLAVVRNNGWRLKDLDFDRRIRGPGSRLLRLLVFVVGLQVGGFTQAANSDHPLTGTLTHADRKLAYQISSDTSLWLRVDPQDRHLKIVSFLNLPILQGELPMDEVIYGIKAEFFTSDKTPLRELTLWEKTTLDLVLVEDQPVSRYFYLNEPVAPAKSRISFVSPPELPMGGFLKLSIYEPADASASIQVFRNIRRTAKGFLYRWEGLRPDIKAKLLEKNLYGSDQISEIEKINALTWQWRQIPAEGRLHVDYLTRELFETESGEPLKQPQPPSDTTILPGRSKLLTINGPGQIRLKVKPLTPTEAAAYFSCAINDQAPITVTEQADYQAELGAGPALVTLTAYEVPVTFDLTPVSPAEWLRDETAPAEGPCFRTTMYYRTSSLTDCPVEVAIPPPIHSEPYLFRIVGRPLTTLESTSPDAGKAGTDWVRCTLYYEILTADDQILSQGAYDFLSAPSRVANLVPESVDGLTVCSPVYLYMAAPAAAKVRLWSEPDAVIALFSKAGVKNQEVTLTPEDYEPRTNYLLGSDNPRTWLYFRPANYAILKNLGLAYAVALPCGLTENPVTDPEEMADTLTKAKTWTAVNLEPLGFNPRYTIFERYERPVLERLQELEDPELELGARNLFGKAPLNRPILIRQPAPIDGAELLQLKLLYQVSESAPPLINVAVDGEPLPPLRVLEPTGFVTIEKAPPTEATFELQGPSTATVFVEQPYSPSIDLYRRRSAFLLTNTEPLLISLEKPEQTAQTLNVICYPMQRKAGERLELTVENLTPFTPVTGFVQKRITRLPRTFSVLYEPVVDPNELLFMELSRGLGRHFVVPFFEDVPAGLYTLRLSIQGQGAALLRCFILQNGVEDETSLRIRTERSANW